MDFYLFCCVLYSIITYYSVSPLPPKTAFTSHPCLAITPGTPLPQVTKEAIAERFDCIQKSVIIKVKVTCGSPCDNFKSLSDEKARLSFTIQKQDFSPLQIAARLICS